MDKSIITDYVDACELVKETEQDIKLRKKCHEKTPWGGKAQAEQIHTCAICRREIIGTYEYIKTKRGTELYICYGCAHPRKSMI